MNNNQIEFSDCFFHTLGQKKYVTLNLAHDLDCNNVGLSSSRNAYSSADFGGWKTFGWYVPEEEDFCKTTFRMDSVKIISTKKVIEDKLLRSAIVKLDMTNDAHRKIIMNVKNIYDRIFRLIADRRADPHIMVAPAASDIVKNICKKKKITEKEQKELDDEIRRIFPMSRIISGLELDSNGEPLPTCEPAIFLRIIDSPKFQTTITDIARGSWKPDALLKKSITGNIRFGLNSISFSGKGIKLNLDATLIYIKQIEKLGAIDSVIAEMEEDVTEEERRKFLEMKKQLEQNDEEESETNTINNGILDDDEYPDDELEME